MTDINFSPVFHPKSIAMIGVSAQFWKWGSIILNNIIVGGYKGNLYPVNPKLDSILGLKVYPNVKSIPDEVDLGIIAIPAAKVPQELEEFEGKVKAALVVSAGFSETEEGSELEKEIVKIARRAKIPLIGPNSMGILSSEVSLNALMPPIQPKRGVMSFVSQSGNLGTQIVGEAIGRGVGFSKYVSSGNEAYIRCEDYVEYFCQDPATKVILAYVEGLREGRRFFELARRATKPIVVYKAGSTPAGSRAAKSHTGAMTGSGEVYKAVFKQAGVVMASTTDELLEIGAAFAYQPLPKGRRTGILTRGGGWGVVGADACSAAGLELQNLPNSTFEELNRMLPPYWSKGNPVDTVAVVNPEVQLKCLEILAKCDEFDALIVLGGVGIIPLYSAQFELPGLEEALEGMDEEYSRKIVELIQKYNKPIITASIVRQRSTGVKFLEENGILVYPTPEKAARILACLVKYQERCRKTPPANSKHI